MKCSFAAATLPDRCSARAKANSDGSVQRIDGQRLLQNGNGLIKLLHLLVTDALKVIRVSVPGVELHCLLETRQRRVQFVIRVLGQSQVVPGLRILRLKSDRFVQNLLGVVELLQRHQRDAFVDGGLCELWILFEGLGEGTGCAIGKLLAHLRHATIVQANCFGDRNGPRPLPMSPSPQGTQGPDARQIASISSPT